MMNHTSQAHAKAPREDRLHLLGAAGLLVLIVMPLAIYGLIDLLTSPTSRWPTEQFSSSSWKSADFKSRYVFYKDLRGRSLLDGATREKVIELLGKPDYAAPDDSYYIYGLKHRENYEISFNFVYVLRIEFEDGRVLSYGMRAD